MTYISVQFGPKLFAIVEFSFRLLFYTIPFKLACKPNRFIGVALLYAIIYFFFNSDLKNRERKGGEIYFPIYNYEEIRDKITKYIESLGIEPNDTNYL